MAHYLKGLVIMWTIRLFRKGRLIETIHYPDQHQRLRFARLVASVHADSDLTLIPADEWEFGSEAQTAAKATLNHKA